MAIEQQSSQTGRSPDPVSLPPMYRQCLLRLQSGDLAGAEALCRGVIRSSPGGARLAHLLGVIVARQGRLDEALGLFTQALEDAPHFPEAWNSRGAVLVELGRIGEALASFDRALADRPEFIEALANRGDAFRLLGRAQEALANYARCLALKPDHARVINHRGLVLAGLGRYHEALDYHDRAIRLSPDDAEAHNARGVALARLGRQEAAIASFARAVSLRPDFAEAFLNHGDALEALARHEQALDSYGRALMNNPVCVEALHSYSRMLAALARPPEDGLDHYERALSVNPNLSQALIGKGNVLCRLERYDEALACYDHALEVSPDLAEARDRRADLVNRLSLAEAHFFRAETLRATERRSEALDDYDQALALRPDYAEAWNGRGLVLASLGEPTDALASYERALALRPHYVTAHTNRGVALRTLGRVDEALAATDRALALAPDDVAALNSRGNTLRGLGLIAEALDSYDRAIAVGTDRAQSHFNRAVCRLLTGDFERGWPEYEWRWQLPRFAKGLRRLPQPLWLGEEDVSGRTVLLYAEQGHGDTIQFCRYVPLVAARGATVLLAVQPLLRSLLASLAGAPQIVGRRAAWSRADFRCPLMSLPLAFSTRLETIPHRVPYLAPPAGCLRRWTERLGPKRGPRIGIAWVGNAAHDSDRDRSLSLDMIEPVAALGMPLYCLQREMRPGDLPAFAMFPNITYFGQELRDFTDTAALIAQLDLVVTVDTAVAHLAGAMGKPVWTLLPFATDWRWLLDREDSPWYPTMRLFRQPRPGDWQPMLDRVRSELIAISKELQSPPVG